jgi:hypothetical protein
MQDFEKLGVFYLGRAYDMRTQRLLDDLLLYDSKDLTEPRGGKTGHPRIGTGGPEGAFEP